MKHWRMMGIVVLLLLAACGKAETDKTTIAPTLYQMKLKQGDVYRVKSTTTQHSTQSMMGMVQTSVQTTTLVTKFETKDVAADGIMHVVITYESVLFEQAGAGETLTYDSTDPNNADSPQAKMYDVMLNKPLDVFYLPNGTIDEIQGMDELIDAMFNDVLPEDAQNDQEAQTMMNTLRDSMKQSIKQGFENGASSAFSDQPVTIGDTWSRPLSMNFLQFMTMNLTNTYTLKSRENTISIIDIGGTGAITAGDTSAIFGEDMGLDMDMSVEQTGSMQIDDTTGMQENSTIEQIIHGTISMKSPLSSDDMSVTIPMTITSTIRNELIK